MVQGRSLHTATLLSNGKVLVVGGTTGSNITATAELYDPATGTWTATGSLNVPRLAPTATLLHNGKVLVSGGETTGFVRVSTAELFDPATGVWMMTGAMNSNRARHTATLLPNGKVLVAGGRKNESPFLHSSAELYDPVTETWMATGALNIGRSEHTATLLPNGKLLVAAGLGAENSAELYDPARGTWTMTGTPKIARHEHTTTLLPNGKVLVTGGLGTNFISQSELYDPISGAWTTTDPMSTGRRASIATLLPNGKVLVAGGQGPGNESLSSAEQYDPITGTWSSVNAMSIGRFVATATLLANGRVLVAGGSNDKGVSANTQLYDSSTGTWSQTDALNTARYAHTATLLTNGLVLAAGGTAGATFTAKCELYDPAVRLWVNTAPLNFSRSGHTATLLPDGKVLAAGGLELSSAELYNPVSGTWTVINSMTAMRRLHTATLLPNGKVLVAGGVGLSSAELYHPSTGTWTPARAMRSARFSHTATLLPNGKVLVAGGADSSTSFRPDVELYDPATETWTITGSFIARAEQTATLLPNGKVLVAGGLSRIGNTFDPISRCDIYDPATGTWTPTGALNQARRLHTAALLPDGRVLVTGGGYAGNSHLASAEIFDPVTGKWTMTGSMSLNRGFHTATLLTEGAILISGGLNTYLSPNQAPTAGAEIYNVGLGFSNSWRPQFATAASPLRLGTSLGITGSRFRGVSEGSSGNTQNSSADYPVVQMRSLGNGQTLFLQATNWSGSTFSSATVTNFPPGHAMVTMFVNGIPSDSKIISIVKGTASLTLSNLTQTYNGTPRIVSATTSPPGLPVTVTYNGSSNAPTGIGSYIVSATVNDPYYSGDTTNTLTVLRQLMAPDASFDRAAGLDLRFSIAALVTNVTSLPAGGRLGLLALGSSDQGATIVTNNAYVLYSPTNNNSDAFVYIVTDGAGASATGMIFINVIKTVGPSLPTNSISFHAGTASVKSFGIPNFSYVLQTATNLNGPWWPIRTNTAGPDGALFFSDPNGTNLQQYYRVAQP